MALDLALPTEVVPCETVREPDGLAMSSRNARLTPEGRAAAPVLRRALLAGAARVRAGERSGAAVREAMLAVLASGAGGHAGLRVRRGPRHARGAGRRSPAGRCCRSRR